MHAFNTICSKPNKKIENSVAYSLQILFLFKTWELIRCGTEQLKTMSPVAALHICVTLLNITMEVMF